MIIKRDSDLDILAKAVTDDSIALSSEQNQRRIRIEKISTYYFSESFKFRSEYELSKIIAKEFAISNFLARKDVDLFKQLYVYANPVDWNFERALLLYSIKNNINTARSIGDEKTVQREHKNLIELIGEEKVDNEARQININVINYNPTLIGAKEIPNLDKVIADMIAQDKAEEEKAFSQYEEA